MIAPLGVIVLAAASKYVVQNVPNFNLEQKVCFLGLLIISTVGLCLCFCHRPINQFKRKREFVHVTITITSQPPVFTSTAKMIPPVVAGPALPAPLTQALPPTLPDSQTTSQSAHPLITQPIARLSTSKPNSIPVAFKAWDKSKKPRDWKTNFWTEPPFRF
ncbi:MAG: hypothetical protein HZB76_02450 [Chlamydiae bacterium]|nr:hypothetical protein [Chlamydiota bacterium]